MNEKACGHIRSCLTKEVKYLVKDEECAITLWRTLEEKYLLKSPENRLHAMSQVYGFRMKPVSMHDHVSRFEKLLADLKNLDEDIKDEVKAMILLHSLSEEYSHFVTTLIYGKSVIVFKDVCTALTSLEIHNNDKNYERASSEALAQKRDGKKPTAANMARKNEGSDYQLSITLAAYVASSSEWILDTGATYHLCPIKECFTDFRNLESGVVVMGNDQPCHTMGIGTIRLKMFDGMIRELKEVRFVPALKKNLIYVGALEAKGYKVTIENGIMKFIHGAMVILQGVRRHNLYYLKGGTTDETNVVEVHSKKIMVKFGTANHDTREILKYVHSDVWGPTKTVSIGGSHYFVTFVDDFSRRVWVYTMRAKDEVIEIFMKWKKLVETQTDRKIKVLQFDNGGEYTSYSFLQVCQNEGIKRHFTVRHTPQQNGVVERMNRTLLEKVQCMLSNAGLDKKFWAEAVSYASHLVNRLPSIAIGGKTPIEMWSGKHAQDYYSLRIFGCPAYYHVKDGKLDSRARKAIFVGFKGGVKCFKLWDLEDKKFMCSRDVTFDEALMIKALMIKALMIKASSSQQVENKTKEVLQREKFDATPYVPVSYTSKKGSTMKVTPRVEENIVSSDVPQNEETIDDVDNDDFIATRRPRREIKKLGWLTKDMVVAYALPVIDDDIPNTFVNCNRLKPWKGLDSEILKPGVLGGVDVGGDCRTTMRIYLQALDYEIWEIVCDGPFMPLTRNEVGEDIPKPSREWNELEKRKAILNSKAMNALFCALDKKEFHRVSSCESANEIWHKLEVVYEGTNQVKESKISRSLPKEWRPKRTAIEEAKDLNILPIDDLIGSLISYEKDLEAERGNEEKKKNIALKASKHESDEESELDEEEMDMLARRFRKLFKKSSERRKFRDLKNQKEKKELIKCYKCKKLGHIRTECPLLNKLKKKAMVATWDDSDEETSDDEEHQEMTNLALMAIGDESDDELDEVPQTRNGGEFLDEACEDNHLSMI
ncbi:hypothetical protein KPL71_012370 [Citrus sinensis]|uniref:Uncharacterized protein n=1 Tax=Citrus sinensis TaxID=2711 RepID=A0ACB8LAT5_CITSI|nr:hypothetical protein KPL71_012370 [Citrus sinensis]